MDVYYFRKSSENRLDHIRPKPYKTCLKQYNY